MKKYPFLLSASIVALSSINAQTHPNVILIITDDQGYGDLGITGNPLVKTPNIDRLGRESMRFTNFYVSPVSAPTRSSLMTGRYSMRTGVRDTNNGGAIMASTEITIAEMLRQEGYATGIFGKWHLGDNYPFRPADQGFDESVIHLSGGMAQPGDITTFLRGDSAYFDPVLWHNGNQERYYGYCSDVYTSNAISFIEKNKSKPFFCYLAFNAPHVPLQVPERYYRLYSKIDPASGFGPDQMPDMTERDKESARRVYAMVTNIDDNIGSLLKKIDELEISEKTIVIFMTDNGPEQRRYVAGMRGLKGTVYNGGIRVPFFIRYPALKVKNRDINVLSAHIDLLPSLAELCNTKVPADRVIDGRSMVPFMRDENKSAPDNRELFFYWTRRNPEKYRNIALMKGKYKLAGQTDYNAGLEAFQLFDLDMDPGEKNNIVKDQPALADGMKKDLDRLLDELSSSENMTDPPRIIIGSEFENPVILNRNDAGGEREVWQQEDIYGTWRVHIAEGLYNLKFRFLKPVPAGGRMKIDLQSISLQSTENTKDSVLIEMKKVPIREGNYDLYPYYEAGNRRILPLWVEVSMNMAGDELPQ